MLRLIQHSRDIKIAFHRRETLFTHEFIRALAIAIFVHLAALMLFKIENVIPPELNIITPVNVHTDIGMPSTLDGTFSSAVKVDQHGLLPRYIFDHEMILPALPEMPKDVIDKSLSLTREDHDPSDFFSQIERIDTPVLQEQLNFLDKEQKKCDIHIAGTLADHQLQPYNIDSQNLIAIAQKIEGEYDISFSVKVEDRTGLVFWYSLDKPSDVAEINELAETILKQLRFEPSYDYLITEGIVEFNFSF